jgi:hypothetical protein
VGALFAMALLLWDKFALSARLMKAQWKVRDLEKEVAQYATTLSPAAAPAEAKVKFPKLPGKADITAPDPDKNG